MEDTAEIVVAGRTFVPSKFTSFEQDLYIMDHIRASGLEEMPDIADSKELDKVAEGLVLSAYRSGRLFHIVAGIMEEVGVPWTTVEAEQNARFFASLRDPKDKASIRGTLVGVILGFFIDEEGSSKISLKSFDAPAADTLDESPESTEESEILVSSTPSSEV
jgi:hypothetical protein